MERLGANKAFTNKLWNAGKFILQNLPARTDAAHWESLTAVEVRWWSMGFGTAILKLWLFVWPDLAMPKEQTLRGV